MLWWFKLINCFISISRNLRILFRSIVLLVSRALWGFCFIQLFPYYLVQFVDSVSSNCSQVSLALWRFCFTQFFVSISRSLLVLFHSIVSLVSRALWGFCLIQLLMRSYRLLVRKVFWVLISWYLKKSWCVAFCCQGGPLDNSLKKHGLPFSVWSVHHLYQIQFQQRFV